MDIDKDMKDQSSTGGKMKFVCCPHKKLGRCPNCQMDFQMLNYLRYDPGYPSSSRDNTDKFCQLQPISIRAIDAKSHFWIVFVIVLLAR